MNEDTFARLLSRNLKLLPQSLQVKKEREYALAIEADHRKLIILIDPADTSPINYEGTYSELSDKKLILCPLSAHNAQQLRVDFEWLQPRVLGLQTSAGMGDRLGLATPGHVRALQRCGGSIAPIFAQQSIREMIRTHRSPQEVMDDATWGIFQEGWQAGVGADADHLKSPEDIDQCLAAGYTFFTIDPGEHVRNITAEATTSQLKQLIDQLPPGMGFDENKLLGKTFEVENLQLHFSEEALIRAMAKYGQAVWHVSQMYNHLTLQATGRPFELEVSVDETELATSHLEHYYIASELKRLSVNWVSLAPRYVGLFEKGVDYIGDLNVFENDIAGHAAIARQLGPYKLSLHSGSDKFSIYALAMEHTRGLVHLKTAGTSYLEALHTLADTDIALLREIYSFARSHYAEDRKSYHVSALIENTPAPENVRDWVGLINQFDAREVFHVTFGSVLTARKADGSFLFYDHIMEDLKKHADVYAQNLEDHFIRHLLPFTSTAR